MQEGIPTSLLKLTTENMARAVKMFGGVQKYMLPDTGPPDGTTPVQRSEIAGKLLHQAIRRPELRDELYMQVGARNLCPGFCAQQMHWTVHPAATGAVGPNISRKCQTAA